VTLRESCERLPQKKSRSAFFDRACVFAWRERNNFQKMK
jgi:hypothetical protein